MDKYDFTTGSGIFIQIGAGAGDFLLNRQYNCGCPLTYKLNVSGNETNNCPGIRKQQSRILYVYS